MPDVLVQDAEERLNSISPFVSTELVDLVTYRRASLAAWIDPRNVLEPTA
jgi:hypothetical protein